MSKVKGQKFTVLKNKQTVITRAGFWKVPHNTREDDVYLKLGRYTKPEDWHDEETPEVLKPRSELTLDSEEFENLLNFLRENYEPFKAGTKAFIPLDKPYNSETAIQIRQLLNLPDRDKVLQFLIANDVVPSDLEIGLIHARRSKAIEEFVRMLNSNQVEPRWQAWFEENSWILGSDFVRILNERAIDVKHISDFLMQSYDGFLDVVEIKRPEGGLQFWSATQDHGNWVPHSDLVKAVTQATIYIHEVEREANDLKFYDRVGVKAIKPRCTLIYGRSMNWSKEQQEAFRILNSSYHNLTIMTYDHVLDRAKRILGRTC